MITADGPQPNDVVEARRASWPADTFIRGTVWQNGDALVVGEFIVGWLDGCELDEDKSVTVVSRAPRPLYVNHDRTEPVNGDSARDADSDADDMVFIRIGGRWWDKTDKQAATLPKHLRLLVDGETGQVVP